MKVFLAGGSGAIGKRLIPLLVSYRHHVVATTRHFRTHSECESSFDSLVIVQVRNNQANEKHRVPDHVCERIAAR